MQEPLPSYLDKAVESLAGAISEYEAGRYNNCANRCHYAMFHAAVHALETEGNRYTGSGYTWSHEALQATFARELVNRRKVYRRDLHAALVRNVTLRHAADYRRDRITGPQAGRALRDSRSFVEAVRARDEARR